MEPGICYRKGGLGTVLHNREGDTLLIVQTDEKIEKVTVEVPKSKMPLNLFLVHSMPPGKKRQWEIRNPHKSRIGTIWTKGWGGLPDVTGDITQAKINKLGGNAAGIRSCNFGKQSADFAIMAFGREGGVIKLMTGGDGLAKINFPQID